MSSSPSDEGPFLPNWVYKLRGLTDYVGFLTRLAKNPVGTLENTVRTIISVIIVGGVLETGVAIIDAVLAVGEALVAVPQAAGALLGRAGGALANSVLELGAWYVATIDATSASLGPAGIFVQVAAYGVTVVVLIQAIPPLLSALSDLLGAIPVIGSVLDAILTFAIDFAASLSEVVGGNE